MVHASKYYGGGNIDDLKAAASAHQNKQTEGPCGQEASQVGFNTSHGEVKEE